MQFTTKVPIAFSKKPINYQSKIVLLGSCFAENMGEKLAYFKFQNTVNPFGIIFNPVSIEKLLERVVNQKPFTEQDIFFHNELWHCYEVHSELSNPNKEEFLKILNQVTQQVHNQLIEATHTIITYGTAWVYRLKSAQEVVANCHKMPQSLFDKEILSVETIQQSIQSTIDLVQKINPNCHFIFTVSPVRHIKDGFVENQRSKAHLITSLQFLLNAEHWKLNTDYFPSYEIMMDELRDYRFYAEDMLHPNQTAINYIWQCFTETTISTESHSIMNEVETIQKGLAHRPFNSETTSHKLFLQSLNSKIIKLQEKFFHIQF
ncbi:GSCFA domain-containing protein [Flavobacterium sp. j3]|uniref:GSCFA domain-containing protein n=1 Tax=Flavobacterium aureirubrum TaxID=3133147 RepID=A0ABU9N0F7_9FLAO